MATERQIEANRLNAQMSTGPTSATGKAKVAQNAIRHGVLAKVVVIEGEDQELFEEMAEQWRNDLCPEGALENDLLERIIIYCWRLRRVFRTESLLLSTKDFFAIPGFSSDDLSGRFQSAQIPLGTLCRYEIGLEKMLMRAIHELQRVQARRTGDDTLIPNAMDFDVSV